MDDGVDGDGTVISQGIRKSWKPHSHAGHKRDYIRGFCSESEFQVGRGSWRYIRILFRVGWKQWIEKEGDATIDYTGHLPDSGIVLGLEPLDGIGLVDSVAGTDSADTPSSLGDTLTWTGHDAVKVHAVDTDARIVLDAQIDVFVDTEAEVAALREVSLFQLVFLDLQTTF